MRSRMNMSKELIVSKTVWQWRSEGRPSRNQLAGKNRMKGLLHGVIGGVVGGLIFAFLSKTVGYVAFTIAGTLTLIALVSPTGAFVTIESFIEKFSVGVGTFVGALILVPIYYLFFTPFKMLARRGRNDSMQRWLDAEASSYWTVRDKKERQPQDYERQF